MEPKRRKSNVHERRIARMVDAKQHPGSGSGKYSRNDMHTDDELIECKRTDNKSSITIDLKELRALGQRADAQGKVPAFCIEVGGEDYVIHRTADWQELRSGSGQG